MSTALVVASLCGWFLSAHLATDCRSAHDDEPKQAPAPPVPSALVDRLDPGELLEGTEQAFGLRLPRGFRVDQRFSDAVYGSGPGAVASFVDYVQARTSGASLSKADRAATLTCAHIASQPGKTFEVRIEALPSTGDGARLEIRDVTPMPQQHLPDDETRWRAAGLRPDGRVIDPGRWK